MSGCEGEANLGPGARGRRGGRSGFLPTEREHSITHGHWLLCWMQMRGNISSTSSTHTCLTCSGSG